VARGDGGDRRGRASTRGDIRALAVAGRAAGIRKPLLCPEQFLHYTRSAYQDRLGTKKGNAERKDTLRFLQVYYEVVAEPMDLDQIDKNLALGESRSGAGISLESRSGGGGSYYGDTWQAFAADMLRVFNNARLFNAEGENESGPLPTFCTNKHFTKTGSGQT
jgi:hypothetical protein